MLIFFYICKINDCNKWSYCLIPMKELEDKERGCCYSSISKNIIENNIINIYDDIRQILDTI